MSLQKLAHAIYIYFFSAVKNLKFHQKFFDIFHIFAQNMDCGYTINGLTEAVLTSTHNLCVPTIYVLEQK